MSLHLCHCVCVCHCVCHRISLIVSVSLLDSCNDSFCPASLFLNRHIYAINHVEYGVSPYHLWHIELSIVPQPC